MTVKCVVCGKAFEANRRSKRFCSGTCYMRAWRARNNLAGKKKSAGPNPYNVVDHYCVKSPQLLATKRTRPPWCSAARWRIEMRRRTDPGYYARCAEA